MVLRHGRQEPVSHMAERIAMDRTTLIRNLELLTRKGLVSSAPAAKGNGRSFTLTPQGRSLADELMPHWQAAQKEVRGLLDSRQSEHLLSALRALTAG